MLLNEISNKNTADFTKMSGESIVIGETIVVCITGLQFYYKVNSV